MSDIYLFKKRSKNTEDRRIKKVANLLKRKIKEIGMSSIRAGLTCLR